jgi:hypothetical protein
MKIIRNCNIQKLLDYLILGGRSDVVDLKPTVVKFPVLALQAPL